MSWSRARQAVARRSRRSSDLEPSLDSLLNPRPCRWHGAEHSGPPLIMLRYFSAPSMILAIEKKGSTPGRQRIYKPNPFVFVAFITINLCHSNTLFAFWHLTAWAAVCNHTIRLVDVPSALRENLTAHVGGCVAAALDPHRQYLGVV